MAARVLIVDDDAGTREGLAELLENAGYETIAADGFESARRVLRTDLPDLLITDIRLGEYNGLQLIITAQAALPAIVISGFTDRVLRSKAEELGATYLSKPLTASAILEVVSDKTSHR